MRAFGLSKTIPSFKPLFYKEKSELYSTESKRKFRHFLVPQKCQRPFDIWSKGYKKFYLRIRLTKVDLAFKTIWERSTQSHPYLSGTFSLLLSTFQAKYRRTCLTKERLPFYRLYQRNAWIRLAGTFRLVPSLWVTRDFDRQWQISLNNCQS